MWHLVIGAIVLVIIVAGIYAYQSKKPGKNLKNDLKRSSKEAKASVAKLEAKINNL